MNECTFRRQRNGCKSSASILHVESGVEDANKVSARSSASGEKTIAGFAVGERFAAGQAEAASDEVPPMIWDGGIGVGELEAI